MRIPAFGVKWVCGGCVAWAAIIVVPSCAQRGGKSGIGVGAPTRNDAGPLRTIEVEGLGPFLLSENVRGILDPWLRSYAIVFVLGRSGHVPSAPTVRVRFRPPETQRRSAPFSPDGAASVEYDFYEASFVQERIAGTLSELCAERLDGLPAWTALSHVAEQGPRYYDAQGREVQVDPTPSLRSTSYYRRHPSQTLVSGERALYLLACGRAPGGHAEFAPTMGWKYPVSDADEVDFSSTRPWPWSWPDRAKVPLERVMDFIRNELDGWETWAPSSMPVPDAGARAR